MIPDDMLIDPTSVSEAIKRLGFESGWAADDAKGIILWVREEPQPTEEELVAAGWVKKQAV